MVNWLFLLIAIVAEVIATTALKLSDGFTKLWPSLVVILGYGAAFFFLSLAIREVPVGVVYAVWSGVGIVLITVVAWLLFNQRLDIPAIIGISLILAGVVVLKLSSKIAVD